VIEGPEKSPAAVEHVNEYDWFSFESVKRSRRRPSEAKLRHEWITEVHRGSLQR
jgi:hypothetical protein